MDLAWLALANAPPGAQRSLWDPRLLWATVALMGLILAGALVIVFLRRWQEQAGEEECPTANEQLAMFRELYERGAMSQEEFNRVRALLADRLRQEMNVPLTLPPDAARNGPAAPLPPSAGPTPP